MKLNQMFPSKYLQAEDLPIGQNTVVTIDKIYPAQARGGHNGDEPEVKFMIRFREYRKPMSLWKNTANTIALALGSDDTDQWIGQQIAIYPATYISYGETKPCINVEKFKPSELSPRTPKPSSGLVVTGDRRPIPKAAMDRFLAHMATKGRKWDDFLRWSKGHCPEALELAFGVDMDAVPAGVLPAMKKFLDFLEPRIELDSGERVDTSTGEVLSSRPTVAAGASKPPVTLEPVDDLDIPF